MVLLYYVVELMLFMSQSLYCHWECLLWLKYAGPFMTLNIINSWTESLDSKRTERNKNSAIITRINRMGIVFWKKWKEKYIKSLKYVFTFLVFVIVYIIKYIDSEYKIQHLSNWMFYRTNERWTRPCGWHEDNDLGVFENNYLAQVTNSLLNSTETNLYSKYFSFFLFSQYSLSSRQTSR